MGFGKYRKFLVAVVGAAVVGLETFTQISVPYAPEGLIEFAATMLTAFGVYQVPNDNT